jgi:ABC-type proline/glycine betaine transport system permease subunit
LFDPSIMLVGAIPVAVLTLGAEGVLAAAQHVVARLSHGA